MKEQIDALRLCIEAIDCIGAIGETPPHYVDMANAKLAKAYTAAKKAIANALIDSDLTTAPACD